VDQRREKGIETVTNGTAMWETLEKHLPRGEWVPLEDVYTIVESNLRLDAEDLSRNGIHSAHPRWKTTVRTLLRLKKQAGVIRGRPGGDLSHGHS